MSFPHIFNTPAVFKDFEKLFVGFDDQFGRLAKVHADLSKQLTNYPPCNVRKVSDNNYVVELALAGFSKQDIDIQIEDGTLTISGRVADDAAAADSYLFRGIANRPFRRSFVLSDRVEVHSAEFFNGLLRISLERLIPEAAKPKKVVISGE